MEDKDLETRFQEAVEIAETIPQDSLPQDVQLRLYSFYKHATSKNATSQSQMPTYDLRSAFKTNAWMQISHLSVDEAKELYIENILKIEVSRKNKSNE